VPQDGDKQGRGGDNTPQDGDKQGQGGDNTLQGGDKHRHPSNKPRYEHNPNMLHFH